MLVRLEPRALHTGRRTLTGSYQGLRSALQRGPYRARLSLDHKETLGSLWYIRYPLADGSGSITVATTRPETMLGDTGVAVNPDDQRFSHLVGRVVRLPLVGRAIPIIADSCVDPEFGTGAVKITPGHDFNDFEIGRRHTLAQISVMDTRGLMNAP